MQAAYPTRNPSNSVSVTMPSGAVCDAIKRAGLARYSWLGKATSWNGSLDYNDWNIKQGDALPFSFDNDSNEAKHDYGGFRLRDL